MSNGQWGGGPPQGPGGGWPPAPGGAAPGAPNSGAPNASAWGQQPPAAPPGSPGSAPALPPTQMAPAFPPTQIATGMPAAPGGWGAPPPSAPGAGPAQPTGGAFGAPVPSNPFGAPPQTGGAFGQQPATNNPFGQPPASNAFGQPPQSNAFGQPAPGGAFGQPAQSNAFGQPAGPAVNPYGNAQPWANAQPFANVPRPNYSMARVVLPIVGIVVIGILGGIAQVVSRSAGSANLVNGDSATSTERDVARSVTRTFVDAMVQSDHASELCGYRVQSVQNVEVSNIQTSGSSVTGSGFASVSGTPVYMPGVTPVPGPCAGNYSFNYRISRRLVGRTWYTNTNLDEYKLYRPIQVGTTVNGALLDGDYRMTSSGRLLDDYGVTLQAGQTITVLVRGGPSYTTPGQNLDMLVGIVANNTELASDDDSAGNLNARVVFTAPAAGLYFIRVSTATRGTQMGTYTVQTTNGANPTAI